MPDQKCGDCKWCVTVHVRHECHAHPPTLVGGPLARDPHDPDAWAFPEVDPSSEVCSDFKK